ncbi:signaling lymphocytic activation molecule isoform X1 [Odocoileus virginianus]|uniref:Signaling lymphocytic activation molecule isoform X1 n=2 Tax=Odocoileus virginianus TaxID=9874 RepID=A0A6J0ZB78_ODOVR|nr:signaling lymphocytic activation molecule isoform X1 [Odocoileus virginianus texanus]
MHKLDSRGSTWLTRSSLCSGWCLRAAARLSPDSLPYPHWLMDPKGLLSLNVLLFFSLIFELSCRTGEGLTSSTKMILGQLGSSVLLPLASKEISRSMNKSIHILVTMAESPKDTVKKKIVSLDLRKGDSPRPLEDGYEFHLENLSLRILKSKKEDEGWYFMSLEENVSVQQFSLQLKLYEQVSIPQIKVLNSTQEDGNCSLKLACMVEKGDHVTYNWSEEAGTPLLSPANSSHLLYLTLGPQHANNVYICTVSNPISNSSQTFIPWSSCSSSPPESRQWGLYAGLFLGGIVGIIMILQVVILLLRRRGKTDNCQPTMEAKSLTIYAQVQKSGSVQKKPDPLPAQDPCTTIYVAATEPVPEPVQESGSFTVYASVTLPES